MKRVVPVLAAAFFAALPAHAQPPEDFDDWRYVAGKPPAAELLPWGSPVFRVTCPRKGELRFDFYFSPADLTPKQAAAEGLDLILAKSSREEDEHILRMPAKAVNGHTVSGRLKLTSALSREIAATRYIYLYGENGPTNNYYGGKAIAFRRLVRECSA